MPSIFRAIADLEENNAAGAICTIIQSQGSTPRRASSKMLVYPDGRTLGTIGGGELENRVLAEARSAIQDGKPRLLHYNMSDPGRGDPGVCGGQVEVYVEPILPAPLLVVVGGGHVGKAVVHLGHWLGFRVALSDDRPEFCNPQGVPGADLYLAVQPGELSKHVEITPWTYLVLTTRNVTLDVQALPGLLEMPSAYIGVIGSRRRWATTRQQLIEKGIPEEQLARVRSPIGLNIKAETPEEIAVSIIAEIIQLRNGNPSQTQGETEA